MPGLRFKIAELEREAKALKTMGTGFLDLQSAWALDRYLSNLRSISGASSDGACTLELHSLRTTPSTKYEPCSRQGGKKIHARISGIWNVRPLGRLSRPNREIEFCGKASTRIALYASTNPCLRLAMWRFELGAEDSPGCYFHAQILGDSDEPPFPKSVPIPRLPSIFVTPMSAVEFVLGELFQDSWARVTTSNSGEAPYWRARQRHRLKILFSWYQSKLDNPLLSPWMTLKDAKPDAGLFS